MKYYLYLLKSTKDNNYYIGQTDNIIRRVKEHNKGKVKSTKSRTPFELIGYKTFTDRNKVRWEEYSLKKSAYKRKKFIESFKGSWRSG